MDEQSEIFDDQFVAYKVRYRLRKLEMSQASLARELDVSEFYISRRVRGEVAFSAVELAKTAQILGVELAYFFPPVKECAS